MSHGDELAFQDEAMPETARLAASFINSRGRLAFPDLGDCARARANAVLYLGAPDDRIMGGGMLGNGGGAGVVGGAAAGPVLLQVRGTFVVPTGAVYEPTDGAVTVP